MARNIHESAPDVFDKIVEAMKRRVPGVSAVTPVPTEDGRLLLRFGDDSFKDAIGPHLSVDASGRKRIGRAAFGSSFPACEDWWADRTPRAFRASPGRAQNKLT